MEDCGPLVTGEIQLPAFAKADENRRSETTSISLGHTELCMVLNIKKKIASTPCFGRVIQEFQLSYKGTILVC